MLDEYEHVPEITAMVDQFDWYILPVTNPDGYVYTWEQVFLFSSLSCKVTWLPIIRFYKLIFTNMDFC